MDDDLDWLRDDALLDVPDNFAQRVMQRIQFAPLRPPRLSWQRKLQNLALIAGGLLGFAQLATFMFGAWIVSSAG